MGEILSESRGESALVELVRRYGGPVSTALLDPSTRLFVMPGHEGAIGYRVGFGCGVALGEPACPEGEQQAFAEGFREHCQRRRWRAVFAVVGRRFTQLALDLGWSALEWGEELVLDPRQDQLQGEGARDLRKKVKRGRKAGVQAFEYRPDSRVDELLERSLIELANDWVAARRGPQVFLSGIRLFEGGARRWFYARAGEHLVGLLTLIRLDSIDGFLVEHLLARPGSPVGTSELLVTESVTALGREGVPCVTFGPEPGMALGRAWGMGPARQTMARMLYRMADRAFHLEAKTVYHHKFRIARTEPSFLVFARKGGMSVRETGAVLTAFHVSWA